ncbi:MAG: hypothetical protein QE487_16745 [Fluviicola sp.]|nr:hypothetical protein [Fluviicola sp.]
MKTKPNQTGNSESDYSSRLKSLQGIAKNDDCSDYKKQLAAIKKKRFDSV